jgi:predicted ATPase
VERISPLIIRSSPLSAYPLNRPPEHSIEVSRPWTEMETNLTIKTLFLIGPSSTGKSTLFHAIVKDMGLDPWAMHHRGCENGDEEH